jgi:hypothetical protein
MDIDEVLQFKDKATHFDATTRNFRISVHAENNAEKFVIVGNATRKEISNRVSYSI